MKNLWSEETANSFIARSAATGINSDLALRIYTTQLLGAEPRLVLHGGGNTSVKTLSADLLGDVAVLCVKGSGADMAQIGVEGLPAVRLAPLQQLQSRSELSDSEMVNFLRINLLKANAPNPSVETLLHAFLAPKYIDHTHATAVLSLTNQPNGAAICRSLYGERMGYVPYIMPGFELAKRAAEIYQANPNVAGLILLKHGIFTFGATAQEAYQRMIDMVTLAEEYINSHRRPVFIPVKLPDRIAAIHEVVPRIRGALAITTIPGEWRRWILDFRTNNAIRNYVDGDAVGRYSQIGVVTPDHVLRTKNLPLLLSTPTIENLDSWTKDTRAAIAQFIRAYQAYFADHNLQQNKTMLDPTPRVILIPGLGLWGVGKNPPDARIAADLAVATVECITDAEAIGEFTGLSAAEIFAMEYWSLEQAKLGKNPERLFERQIVLITGGASGIGAATARAFARNGAAVIIVDQNLSAAQQIARECAGIAYCADVTHSDEVRAAFDTAVNAFGGIDIVISNAGAAWQGTIGTVSDSVLRASFELNFYAHQSVAQNAIRIMEQQQTGGCLLFNISKQALNPGADFGPYGLPKAATLALMKQYALDYGRIGIRSNAVNADRVRTGLLTDEMISQRAQARGVTEYAYMAGNLLGLEVQAEDVAAAFLYLANAKQTTACTITVDGGNIAASLR